MVTISILYPNLPGSRFDLAYYVERHMPRAMALLRQHPGYRGVSVERGLGGAAPGTEAAYTAMCHFKFESQDAFMSAFMPHAAELQGDMVNYSEVAPIIQVSDVLILGN